MVMNIINAQAPSLYFSAIGPGKTGPDLYRIAADGTLTPIPVNPASTAGSNAGENGGYANFNGKLYFFADTAAGPAQLLVVNPDGSITPVAGISGIPNISDSQLPGVNAHFTAFDGKLFFAAQGPQGVDIYSIDANGNIGAVDKSGFIDQPVIAGDNVSIYSNDNGFAVFDGGLYFSAFNASFGIPQLFRLDAGSNSPVVVGEDSAAYVGEDGGFVVNAGMLIFNGWPFDTQTDSVLGLAAGSNTPQTLTDVYGNPILHTFLTPSRFHGEFFIAADNYTHLGDALFVDQGGNISELHDPFTPDGFGGIAPYLGPGLENGLVDFNGSLYFSANHHLNRLSFSTGTAIIAGVDDTAGEDGGFVVFNNKLYFFAQKNGAPQLYSLGTTDQLTAVTGVSGSFSGDAHFTVLGSNLYLEGPTANGIELIRIDSAGVVQVSDINPGSSSSFPGATGGFAIYRPATVGTAGDDQINGTSDADDIDGAGGNDIILASGGDDTIRYTVGQGHDATDGGTGTDTLRITGTSGDEAYGLWTVAAWNAAHAASPYAGTAEILLSVNGSIVNEIRNVEEITLAANGGTDSLDVEGNFTGTSLTTSTITYQGGQGSDTVDLSHRTSAHSVIADGGAGTDTAILGFAYRGAGATYQQIRDSGGNVIGAKITHTVGGQSVTDTFTNFENFIFTSGTRTLATLFDDPPVASSDKASVNEDMTLVLAGTTLTANDTDPDNDPLTVTAVQNASHGAVSLDSGNISFTPDPNFSGVAGFDYTVGDGKGGFGTAHVAIDVAPKADPVNLHLPAPVAGSDFSTGSGGDSAIASLANGNFVVASLGNSRSVNARLFDVHGNPLGNAFSVAASTGHPVSKTHVVALAGGEFVVSWDSFLTIVNGAITSSAVFAQRFHADGTPDGAQFSPSNGSYGINNSTAATADGGFVVTWQSGTDVVAQRFDANAGAVGGTFTVAQPNSGAVIPNVAALEGGGFVVIWGPLNLSGRVYDAQGHGGDVFSLGVGFTNGPAAVAGLAGGGFVVEWSTGGGEVSAQIFNASGVASQPAFHVANGYFGGVTALSNGGFVVTFTGTFGSELHAQQFDAAGNPVGAAVRLDQPDGATLDFNAANGLATLANGNVAAVWSGAANIFPTGLDIGVVGVTNQLVTLSTIGAALNDADGSETFKLVLSGFPVGATFSVGHAGTGPDLGKWVIDDADQIAGLSTTALKMTPAANYSGSFTLHVDAVATDTAAVSTGSVSDTRTTSATIDVNITAGNTAPVAHDDSNSALVGGAAVSGNVLTNDTDADHNALTVTAVSNANGSGTPAQPPAGQYGVLTISSAGDYTYTPNSSISAPVGSHATDVFTYQVSDGHGGSASASLTITLDRAPFAAAHTISLREGASVGFSAAGDADPDGDGLTVTGVKFGATSGTVGQALAGTYGSLTLKSDGTYSYAADNIAAIDAAATGSHPTDVFTYTVDDGHGGSTTETLVFSIDRAPQPVNDAGVGIASTTVSVDAAHGVLANDSDPDGDALAVHRVTGSLTAGLAGSAVNGSYGHLQINSDGSYSYATDSAKLAALPGDQHPHDVFYYSVVDPLGLEVSAQIDITIDRLPDATTHSVTVLEGSSTGLLAAGDTDPDGDTLTVTAVAFGNVSGTVGRALAGTYGSLTIKSDGTYSCVADNTAAIDAAATGSHPTDTFSYTVDDGHGGTATETLTVTIDRAPSTATHSLTLGEGGSSGSRAAGDTDPDGDTLTVTGVKFGSTSGTVGQALGGTYGALTIKSDDTYSYTANKFAAIDMAAKGSHPTDTFTYTVDDGHGGSTTETLTFIIERGPLTAPDTVQVLQGGSISVDAAHGILANDADPDGDPLTVLNVISVATHQQQSAPATIGGSYGTLHLDADGSYSYSASGAGPTGQHAQDIFDYSITDGFGAQGASTLTVTIDRAPDAATHTVTVLEGGSTGLLAAGDTDPDGDTLTVTAVAFGNVSGTVGQTLAGTYGSLTIKSDDTYSYVADNTAAIDAAATGSHPTDTFSYTVDDGHGGTTTETLTVGIDRAPSAADDSVTMLQTASLSIDAPHGVLGNDGDPDGDATSVVAVAGSANNVGAQVQGTYGLLTLRADGSYGYSIDQAFAVVTAASGSHPHDKFSYTISDGTPGGTATANVDISIDRPPTAAADTGFIAEGSGISAATHLTGFLGNDRDSDGDTLTITSFKNATGEAGTFGVSLAGTYGHLTLGADGAYSYVADNISAIEAATASAIADNFVYTVSDGLGGTATADVDFFIDRLPVIHDLDGDSTTYDRAGLPVHLDVGAAASVSDADFGDFYKTLTVSIGANKVAAEDVLAIDTSGAIHLSGGLAAGSQLFFGASQIGTIATNGDGANGNDFVVNLFTNADAAAVGALIQALTYQDNNPNNLSVSPRTVTVTLSDTSGATSKAANVTVDVSGVNQPAIVAGDLSGQVTEAGGINNAIPGTPGTSGQLTDTDPDNTPNLFTASSGASQNGYGTFMVLADGNWSYTLDNSKAAVEALNAGQTLSDSFTVTTIDGTAQTIAITIAGADDLPVGSPNGPTSAHQVTDEQVPVAIDASLTVTDPDNATLPSATVTITGGYQPGEDVLAFANTDAAQFGNITASFANGVLSLSSAGASATLAQWQAALHAVTYTDMSDTPSTIDRTISFVVNDGTASNLIATDTVGIVAINDAPVNHAPFALAVTGGVDNAITGLSVTDPDAGTGSETTTLSVGHGVLAVAAAGGAAVSGSGSASVTIGGTLAAINATLAHVSYHASAGFSGLDTLTVTTNDGGNSGAGGPLGDTDPVLLNVDVTHLTGTPGNDSFTALPGNETINALGGVDTVTFGFKLVDARISFVGNQVIIDGPNGSSHTVLTGFEVYKFTDGTVNDNDGDPLVDDLFYYSQNHDVWLAGADADAHYHTFGWKEGRDPDAFFSTSTYLSENPSLKGGNIDPLVQFDQGGWKTSDPSIAFGISAYLKANPDAAIAGIDPLAHFLQFGEQEGRQPIAPITLPASNGFDYVYYLQHNSDVAAAHVDPLVHYETVGWREGRNPNAYFDVKGYLAHYADVAAAGINPLDHYDQVGWKEGRDPSPNFDTKAYLAAYPDVAAAHVDPLEHFLKFGIAEGRTPHGDGVWG